MPIDPQVLTVFEESLTRTNTNPAFLDRFYNTFLAASPKVAEKFAGTDFVRQKRALRASLHTMLLVASDEESGPERYLQYLAARHSSRDLSVGSELYDYWLDSLLATVQECDPQCTPEVLAAWENVMMVGIRYLLRHY
jgi:hemoglobin-like flavoprotein